MNIKLYNHKGWALLHIFFNSSGSYGTVPSDFSADTVKFFASSVAHCTSSMYRFQFQKGSDLFDPVIYKSG